MIEQRFLAQVSRNLFGESEYYKINSEGDEYIESAIYELLEGHWFGLQEGRLYLLPSNTEK